MKNIIIGIIAILLLGTGVYWFLQNNEPAEPVFESENEPPLEAEENTTSVVIPGQNDEPEEPAREPMETIGTSVGGTDIVAYHFGEGDREVLIVGGIHSGFAPNTVAVADQLTAALEDGDMSVPAGLMITVIPNLNPDAPESPNTVAGRLNENDVDLNRNFDCEWKENATWRSTAVSGGDEPFSEPEAAALRDYVEANNVVAAVVYYAADGGVYASNCGGSLDPEIATLTGTYAEAAGYTANEEFDAYAISGDATNWMAKVGVPAIGVLLSNYADTEWEENMAGIEAVLALYATE